MMCNVQFYMLRASDNLTLCIHTHLNCVRTIYVVTYAWRNIMFSIYWLVDLCRWKRLL